MLKAAAFAVFQMISVMLVLILAGLIARGMYWLVMLGWHLPDYAWAGSW